jgi:hypothetical protein
MGSAHLSVISQPVKTPDSTPNAREITVIAICNKRTMGARGSACAVQPY